MTSAEKIVSEVESLHREAIQAMFRAALNQCDLDVVNVVYDSVIYRPTLDNANRAVYAQLKSETNLPPA